MDVKSELVFYLNKGIDGRYKTQQIAAEMVPVSTQRMFIEVAEISIQRMAINIIKRCHTEIATSTERKF